MANHFLRSVISSGIIKNAARNTSPAKISARLRSVSASKLLFEQFGEPCKVVNLVEEEITDIESKDVLVKMLAAPVNPADINTIQGTYPAPLQLPAVPGNEGVAEVIQVGSEVSDIAVGDRVVPLTSALGTWRTHAVLRRDKVYKVPKELGLIEAATLTVNPCTAYRMLKDFADLAPGDVVIQNGANSACGQYAIQLCKAWGLKSVNVIRDRPDLAELTSFLKSLGATYVLTEEELRTTDLFKSKTLPRPKLGLNCVGGKNALEVMRHLDNGSCFVTYGGMSREPVTVTTSALIFKNLQIRGFWMTRWSKENFSSSERFKMMDDLISLMTKGQLQGPAYKMIDFNNFKEAIMSTLAIKGKVGKKYILGFPPPEN